MIEVTIKHPPARQNYAAFTNQEFLQREVGVVAERLLDGATEKEIQREILEHDLFRSPPARTVRPSYGRYSNASTMRSPPCSSSWLRAVPTYDDSLICFCYCTVCYVNLLPRLHSRCSAALPTWLQIGHTEACSTGIPA